MKVSMYIFEYTVENVDYVYTHIYHHNTFHQLQTQ